MVSVPGNKNGTKIKDPEMRQIAYEDYCAHLATGKNQRSWVFEKYGHTLTSVTMESYIKDKKEFDPRKKEAALCKGFARWEQICEDSAEGYNEKANTASLQMIMRNKFGWDKKEDPREESADHQEAVRHIDALMSQLRSLQAGARNIEESKVKAE
jgi:hypothetical protein